MKAGRKKQVLTEKELEIMRMLWNNGKLFVRQMVELYPAPKPHQNTVSTTVRILEEKGYVAHETVSGSFCYFAAVPMAQFRERSFAEIVSNYFNNSYRNAVSSLVEEEKITLDELREIIKIVENNNK